MKPNLDHLSTDPHLDAAKIALEQREIDDYISYLTGLLSDEYCAFAEPTLFGIRQSVIDRRVITFAQRIAVENIKTAADRNRERDEAGRDHRPSGSSRRYEGFSGRPR